MKLLLLGATGQTGRHLLRQALDRGHHVTAFVRHPDAVALQHDRLSVVQGDATDADAVRDAASGHDGALFAIGANNPMKESTLVSDATRNVVAALSAAGGGRLVAISVLGVGDSAGEGTFFYDNVLSKTFLRGALADRERQEAALRDAPPSVRWTAVRATLLTDDPPRFAPTILTDGAPGTLAEVPRADLAAFMLDALEGDQYVGQAPAVGYPAS